MTKCSKKHLNDSVYTPYELKNIKFLAKYIVKFGI